MVSGRFENILTWLTILKAFAIGIIHYLSTSFTIVRYHTTSLGIIRHHSLSFDIIHYHSIRYPSFGNAESTMSAEEHLQASTRVSSESDVYTFTKGPLVKILTIYTYDVHT